MKILATGSALGRHTYEQAELTAFLGAFWRHVEGVPGRLQRLHENTRVERRHLALPLEAVAALDGFGAANAAWIEAATELGAEALLRALDRAGLTPVDVDAVFFSTVTGVASPSIDARIAHRIGLRSDVRRVPMFGLGCVAGVAGTARAADHVRGWPGHVAVALMVELCSLTLQRNDTSTANLIASGLFGDGASAVVVAGADRDGDGPRIVATRSVLYPDSEDVMGWNVTDEGFRILLSKSVPAVAREHAGRDVDTLLAEHGIGRDDVGLWVCHPGGPKVLAALRDGLEVDDDALRFSRDHLRECGNLSSASVLMVLEEVLATEPPPGTWAVMIAMGPGFCSEVVLLRF